MNLNCALCGGLLLAMLTGCGGREDLSQDKTQDEILAELPVPGPPVTDATRKLTVADIAGVWDMTYTPSDPEAIHFEDIHYLVIAADGKYLDFDYHDDETAARSGNARNCYTLTNEAWIAPLASGGFKIVFDHVPTIVLTWVSNFALEDDHLITALSPGGFQKGPDQIMAAPRAMVTRNDMEAMLCDES